MTSLEVIVSLIAATTTRKGLKVQSEPDRSSYPAGVKVRDMDMAQVNLHGDEFHGDWNYEIVPQGR